MCTQHMCYGASIAVADTEEGAEWPVSGVHQEPWQDEAGEGGDGNISGGEGTLLSVCFSDSLAQLCTPS